MTEGHGAALSRVTLPGSFTVKRGHPPVSGEG
jgi:hypothetical protein